MKKFLKKISMPLIAAVLCTSMVFTTVGCTQADVQKTVSLIAAELPTAISIASEVLTIVSAVGATQGSTGDGAQAQITAVGVVIKSDLSELQTLVASYQGSPNPNTWASIINVVDTLVGQGDTALLAAADIKDPTSQAKATAIIGSLDAILHIVDGYIQATQTTAQVQATAKRRAVKLNQVSELWNKQIIADAAAKNGMTYTQVVAYETAQGY